MTPELRNDAADGAGAFPLLITGLHQPVVTQHGKGEGAHNRHGDVAE